MVAHQAGTIRRVAATARNMMMSTAALLLALLAPKTVPVTPPPAATQAKDVVASPEGIAKMLAALAVAAPTTSVAKLSTRAALAGLARVPFDALARPVVLSLARPKVGSAAYIGVHVTLTDPDTGNAFFRNRDGEPHGGVELAFDAQAGRSYAVECAATTAEWSVAVVYFGNPPMRTVSNSRIGATDRPMTVVTPTEDTRILLLLTPELEEGESASIGRCQIASMVAAS